MLNMLRQRRDEDEGFTLIELMVVVLIIAILIAIAIPTFLGAQDRARDRAAQSDLRNAITAAKTIATDSAGLFQVSGTNITDTDMAAAEPSLTFVPSTGTATASAIKVTTAGTGASITLEKLSASGKSFGISATSSGVVTYCKGAAAGDCDTAAENTLSKW